MTSKHGGVGLGTFPFAGPFSPVASDTMLAILRKYVASGGSYIDTAPTYSHGAVERLLGSELLASNRDKIVLATSCGYVRTPEGKYRVSGKYADVMRDCEESLARLGTDYIDVYYSHIPDMDTPFDETIDAMRALKERGAIRSIGVSNVTLEQLRQYNAHGDISFVQNRFSPINRALPAELINYCAANDISVVAYQVLERGILTDRGARGLQLRSGDLRESKPEFSPNALPRLSAWVDTYLKPLAAGEGIPIASLVIWWALQLPGVALCQCGATSPRQLEEVLGARTLSPRVGILEALESAYAVLERQIRESAGQTVRAFMGLEAYDIYKGSASGEARR
jgi:aryl-alcohol dehydrogenase-like predicted oxidoreductase